MAPIITRSTTTNIRPVVDGRGGILLVMYWTECSIAIIMVSLRFYCRIKIRGVGLDDWTMLLTLVNREKKEKKKEKKKLLNKPSMHFFKFRDISDPYIIPKSPDPCFGPCSSSNPQYRSRWCPTPLSN